MPHTTDRTSPFSSVAPTARAGARRVAGGLFALGLCLAAPLQAADFNFTVDSITDVAGTLRWSVYDNKENYSASENPVAAGRHRVTGETLEITLHGLPDGHYAIKLFHDANDNGELDSNALGLPQEGYGFSNNAGRFGPAKFDDAKVEIAGDTAIVITLR
ncbi:MAG: DUF2141 domain-containing protein [Pseudomonadota bacterium]